MSTAIIALLNSRTTLENILTMFSWPPCFKQYFQISMNRLLNPSNSKDFLHFYEWYMRMTSQDRIFSTWNEAGIDTILQFNCFDWNQLLVSVDQPFLFLLGTNIDHSSRCLCHSWLSSFWHTYKGCGSS